MYVEPPGTVTRSSLTAGGRCGRPSRHWHVAPAARRVAAFEPEQPRLPPLLRRAVMLGVAELEVTHGERGADRLLHVTRLQQPAPVHRVAPRPGQAIGLQFDRLGGRPDRALEDA